MAMSSVISMLTYFKLKLCIPVLSVMAMLKLTTNQNYSVYVWRVTVKTVKTILTNVVI